MIIREIEARPHIGYSVGTKILTIGGVKINLPKQQGDSQTIINITRDGDTIKKEGGNRYVATVFIPPKQYEMVDANKKDENGNAVYNKVAVPLDFDKVTLALWKYESEIKQDNII